MAKVWKEKRYGRILGALCILDEWNAIHKSYIHSVTLIRSVNCESWRKLAFISSFFVARFDSVVRVHQQKLTKRLIIIYFIYVWAARVNGAVHTIKSNPFGIRYIWCFWCFFFSFVSGRRCVVWRWKYVSGAYTKSNSDYVIWLAESRWTTSVSVVLFIHLSHSQCSANIVALHAKTLTPNRTIQSLCMTVAVSVDEFITN